MAFSFVWHWPLPRARDVPRGNAQLPFQETNAAVPIREWGKRCPLRTNASLGRGDQRNERIQLLLIDRLPVVEQQSTGVAGIRIETPKGEA